MREEGKSGVQGANLIAKACDILDLVGEAAGSVAIHDLVERTGLPKSTVYRIVAALGARGLLRNNQRGQTIALGFHFLDLAHNVWTIPDLVGVASLELRRLRDMTGETAYLAALSGSSAVTLARYVGAHENSSMSALGSVKPLHCTSQGKAIVAHLPAREADHLVAGLHFDILTPRTLRTRDLFKTELEQVRARGFAIDDQEIFPGVRCVGAPVFDREGACVGAISVTGPAYRMTLERIDQLGPELVDAAARIRANLAPAPAKAEAGPDIRALGQPSFHGAMPFWSRGEGRLYWADRLAPAVYTLRNGEETQLLARTPEPIEALLPAPEGGVDVLCDGGWRRLLACGTQIELVAPPPIGLVAACMDRAGERWAAIRDQGRTQVGRLDAGGFHGEWTVNAEITALAGGRDGLVYGADGARGVVYEFRQQRAAPHVLARLPRGAGEPRALAVDPDGGIWVGLWEGWSVARLDESGEIERILALPAPRPSGLAFGGDKGERLFVTTARLGLAHDILANAPASGRLHVFDAWR
ncbi:DNA-binding IclR family transcriptional regulator [Rhodoblastus acidophilus]|uniref:IclR family transcriptional regulator domain-containing protein n=1 Tax=Rhodoblastus acidophilus TaxID=1074 RepID=UPI002224EC2A|nr:IclR family transcriptional regulator C-terminal domain-containing protein [Rhodoblastus acidophilus]MCW2286452.1 DNA-binding IclR family transcriptional regulator [Rhodoblastus acidophilus]MCW2335301.1 DNA-binding IclR family transcriptional regulator [Rhodoblastus acidophilus]